MNPERLRALELAVGLAGQRGSAEEIVVAAGVFHNFLTGSDEIPSVADTERAIETSEADAKPVKAKPAAKPAAEKAAPKADPKPEPAEKPAAKETAEVTATQCSQAVVKLVTKIGRDAAIQWMQTNFKSPNVSGLDTSKHSYASVVKKIQEHIASLETSPAE